MEQDNINLIDTLNNLMHNWWKIAMCTVIFAVLGLAFSFISPPKYEAEALFSVVIDYRELNFENLVNESGQPYELTQYDIDLSVTIVPNALIKVRNRVINFAQSLDPELDANVFEEDSVIERLHDRWRLRFRHQDPQIAQSIVDYWADAGMEQLEKEQAAETMQPFVQVDLILRPDLPQTPIYQNRSSLLLAGLVIGICLGILVFDMRYRYFKLSTKQHDSQVGE